MRRLRLRFAPRFLVLVALIAVVTVGSETARPRVARAQGLTIVPENAVEAMHVDTNAIAYDFSVTDFGGGLYLGLFHAEPYQKSPNCWGDTTAVKYLSPGLGPTQQLAFGTHYVNADALITRTAGFSNYLYDPFTTQPDCASGSAGGGAGNPILIYEKYTGYGAVYFLDNHWETFMMASGGVASEVSASRNFMMVAAAPWSYYSDIRHNPMMVLSGTVPQNAYCFVCGAGDHWEWKLPTSSTAALESQTMDPWPTHDYGCCDMSTRLVSMHFSMAGNDGIGLIGSMSYTADTGTVYYFYNDTGTDGEYKLKRRTVTPAVLTEFSLPDQDFEKTIPRLGNGDMNTPKMVVNRSASGSWLVLYNCDTGAPTYRQDICVQAFPSADLVGLQIDAHDAAPGRNLGIGIPTDPLFVNSYYHVFQFNVLKDGWGWHNLVEGGQQKVVVYFTANQTGNPYAVAGASVYSKKVAVF